MADQEAYRDRPRLPKSYGIPATDEGLLPWSWVEERLANARNYWVSTTHPDGRPHARPIWGVWLDGAFSFDGSPETRRNRNIAANPAVSVHLESGDQVVILEGTVHEAGRPSRDLAERLVAAYTAKYAASGYTPTPDQWDRGGLYVMRPARALAWGEFPTTVTRWRFPAA